MLHEFLIANREAILNRSRSKRAARKIPIANQAELVNGLPLFLDQLIAILRTDKDDRTPGHEDVSASAALHGGDLLREGLTVGQVVQDYGSICQCVTELADENSLAITADEFKTFNRCLDDAIAQAVTSYEHQRDHAGPGGARVTQLGVLAHEMRNLLMTSMLTFEALAKGSVGIHGSTGTLLGRSLRRMRTLIDRTLADVRLDSGNQTRERVSIAELVEEVQIAATIEANERGIQLTVDPGPSGLAVEADQQILVSAVANLVQNAFKFTRSTGHISVRAYTNDARVLIDVQDECGGLPEEKANALFRPFERHGADHTGLGLGLAISLKGVRASGGEIHFSNLPGAGCLFTVDLPMARPVS